MRHRALIAAAVVAAVCAARYAAGVVVDLQPAATTAPTAQAPQRPLLARTHDLFRTFAEGDGTLTGDVRDPWPSSQRRTVLPWRIARGREGALQVDWMASRQRQAGTTVIALARGQRWCTARLASASGARLRFEALTLDGRGGRLLVSAGEPSVLRTLDRLPSGPGGTAVDLPLSAGAEVCFAADGGWVGVAEPRVVAPVPSGDARPRWVVLAISDSLRADAWLGPESARIAPRAAAFAANARRYLDAHAPGSHTSAAMWPIFSGRDLMRIDPARRLSALWGASTPLDAVRVFSHPNLFLSHYAEAAGYRTAFFGNNSWIGGALPAFARFAVQGSGATGTDDGMRELPAFLERYADERLLLVHWTSAAHRGSDLVPRLVHEFGCGGLRGIEQLRCEYRARVRHNDEGVGALLDRLAYHGVRDEALVVLTADHGDALEDGWAVEAPDPEDGVWKRLDSGHGSTTGSIELAVPLLIAGPGIAPESWAGRVSTLDLVPTLVAAMGVRLAGRVDGQVLPRFPGGTTDDGRTRRLVAYGYCGHSDTVADRQLVWWDGSSCPVRRPVGGVALLRDSFELRVGAAVVPEATPGVLQALRRAHAEWLADRVAGETIVLDPSGLPRGSVVMVSSPEGRIVDHGPSGTVWGLEHLGPISVGADQRTISVRFDGFRGFYAITTRPARTKVEVRIANGGRPTVFVGPYQLPLEALGVAIDPTARPDYVVSATEPPPQATAGNFLRLWWQPYEPITEPAGPAGLEEFNRVLREWGYIR